MNALWKLKSPLLYFHMRGGRTSRTFVDGALDKSAYENGVNY